MSGAAALLLEGQAFFQSGSGHLQEDDITEQFMYVAAGKEKILAAIKKELSKGPSSSNSKSELEKQQFSVIGRFVSFCVQYFTFKEGELCL